MTPHGILLYPVYPSALLHHPSEKLPPTADKNKYRDLKPDTIERVRDPETLSHNQDFSIKSFSLRFQG